MGVVDKWVEKAEYDLETAKAMLDAKRHLYVLFCCQQTIEKMLKAVFAKRMEETPPRVHSLVELSRFAGL